MKIINETNGDYLITTDNSKIDFEVVHQFLATSYWCEGIPKPVLQKAIDNSLCFSVFHSKRQIGFARIISDFATFAYLADVFILEEERGKGLSKWLMKIIMAHPNLQHLRRFTLATADAHELYKKFGFTAPTKPKRMMEISVPGIYLKDEFFTKE